jgi:hypothetical protein
MHSCSFDQITTLEELYPTINFPLGPDIYYELVNNKLMATHIWTGPD